MNQDPTKAVSLVAKREKEIKEWNEQALPKVLPGYSGDCQEEAQKRKAEMKWRKRRTVER